MKFFLGLVLVAVAFAQTDSKDRSVWFAEIRGTIDPASSRFLSRAIREAEKDGAEALVVELDTPGGLVSSVKDMAQFINKSKVPIVVYVAPGGASATSAGALLTFASHVAAMAPGTHIGAAHPVGPEGKDISGKMGEKAVNDVAAFARGLAELRGRNRELAEAVVTKSKSFTAEEAKKQEMVEVIASSRAELLQKIDGRMIEVSKDNRRVIRVEGATVKTINMTWGQKILHLLANPNIATLLMALGVLCIYIEITTPGITIPGILGGIAILVAFISFQMLPIRTGGFLLLILGVGFLIAEAFVVSHGALAVGGIISFVLGVIWVLDPAETDLKISPAVWVPAALALGGGAAVIAFAAAKLKEQAKKALAQIGGGGYSGLAGYQGRVESVIEGGLEGKALIRGEVWDFEASTPLSVGDLVEVEKVIGFRLVVKVVHEK